jgi:predicted ATP-grasp superfamily ATP-dependent carboligase
MSSPVIKVLVFPCGAENAIELHEALSYSVNIEVWGASSREDHGRYVFKNYIGGVPFISEQNFLTNINQIISNYGIDLIFPTHDTIAQYLAEHRSEIRCQVIMANDETTKICRDKKRIYELIADSTFAPRLYSKIEDVEKFPIFLKPRIGEGGKGTHLIKSAEEGIHILSIHPDLLLVEYLPGDEFTVDCFTDRKSRLRFVGARVRSRINYGISVNSKTVPLTPEIMAIAEELNQRLQFRGLWFFQLKKADDQTLKLLEISTRTAGTMCLYRYQGVNLPLLSVYDAMDKDVEILQNEFSVEVDRALFSRFQLGFEYDAIYLDFDDTFICRGEVNPYVLILLYQAASLKKHVYLLTRHEKDIYETLAKARIHEGLFTEICVLTWHQEKYDMIRSTPQAIFIDNSYLERKKVKDKLGIPVFDVDAVSALIDWRK